MWYRQVLYLSSFHRNQHGLTALAYPSTGTLTILHCTALSLTLYQYIDLNFIVQHFIILHLLNCHFCVYLIIYCSISKFYISSLSHNWQSYIATINYILMSKQQKDIDAMPIVLRGDRGGLRVATWPESRPSTLNLNTVKTFTLNFTFKDLKFLEAFEKMKLSLYVTNNVLSRSCKHTGIWKVTFSWNRHFTLIVTHCCKLVCFVLFNE